MGYGIAMSFLVALPALAGPGYLSDSLLIRAILDSNGMTDRTVESVGDYSSDEDRFVNLHFSSPTPLAKPFYLPPEIGGLDRLKKVSITGLGLVSLPPEIANLDRLGILDLSGNGLPAIPMVVFELFDLTRLELGSNNISSLPDSFGKLNFLEHLDLRSNKLTSIPYYILEPRYLKSLDISKNPLATIPVNIFGMDLAYINAADCELSSLPEDYYDIHYKYKFDKKPEVDFSGNKLCHIPVPASRWINTFTSTQKWNGTQRCPAGEEAPPGIYLASHGFFEEENQSNPIRLRLGKDMGDSVAALMEWDGLRIPLMLAASSRIPASGEYLYAGDISKFRFPSGLMKVNISVPLQNGDTISVHTEFKLTGLTDPNVGPPHKYIPPRPDDYLAADFAPMEIGNQWVYAGKVTSSRYPIGSSYITRISVTDTATVGENFMYRIEVEDSVYGITAFHDNEHNDIVKLPDTFARVGTWVAEDGESLNYLGTPESAMPEAMRRVQFSHSHSFRKSQCSLQRVGPGSAYVVVPPADRQANEPPHVTILQNVGTTDYLKSQSYSLMNHIPWRDAYTVKDSGYLVAFTSVPASLIGKGYLRVKSAAPTMVPKTILKNRKILYLNAGKAYNGKGQRAR